MQIHVKTGHSPEGMIVSEIQDDMRRTIGRKVLMTQEQQIRRSLIEMGWTPPDAQPLVVGLSHGEPFSGLTFTEWLCRKCQAHNKVDVTFLAESEGKCACGHVDFMLVSPESESWIKPK